MISEPPTDAGAGKEAPPKHLLWTDRQVADVLGVKPGTVRYLHRMRLLVGVKCGGHLRWKPAAVARYVQSLDDDEQAA